MLLSVNLAKGGGKHVQIVQVGCKSCIPGGPQTFIDMFPAV